MNPLGDVIKKLRLRRNLTQKELARLSGISEPSVSFIVNGRQEPKPDTIAKLAQVLCKTDDERLLLISAAEQTAMDQFHIKEPHAPQYDLDQSVQEALMRGSDYLAKKAGSISFRSSVEDLLISAKILFKRDFVFFDEDRKLATDFMVETTPRIVLECKYVIDWDWERSLGQCLILKQALGTRVILCVPWENSNVRASRKRFMQLGIDIVEIGEELITSIQSITKAIPKVEPE
jgi:transcriptional regulator with XRE-family HTH domain